MLTSPVRKFVAVVQVIIAKYISKSNFARNHFYRAVSKEKKIIIARMLWHDIFV